MSKKITCRHRKIFLSGLPTQNRIQQNFGVDEAHPKIHGPGGHTTDFEDPCRTLMAIDALSSALIAINRTPLLNFVDSTLCVASRYNRSPSF